MLEDVSHQGSESIVSELGVVYLRLRWGRMSSLKGLQDLEISQPNKLHSLSPSTLKSEIDNNFLNKGNQDLERDCRRKTWGKLDLKECFSRHEGCMACSCSICLGSIGQYIFSNCLCLKLHIWFVCKLLNNLSIPTFEIKDQHSICFQPPFWTCASFL